jgi:hypothetical protein
LSGIASITVQSITLISLGSKSVDFKQIILAKMLQVKLQSPIFRWSSSPSKAVRYYIYPDFDNAE